MLSRRLRYSKINIPPELSVEDDKDKILAQSSKTHKKQFQNQLLLLISYYYNSKYK